MMNDFYINKAVICINEFNDMLRLNKYLSKKLVDDFFDKYMDLFDYVNKNDLEIYGNKLKDLENYSASIISERNKRYIDNKLIEYKDYFDNMFKGIDDNIKLDVEQRRAILMDEDYSLIIAGAGSGKTTTMAAKVKFLIDKCNVDPKKIIVLGFTRKAVLELDTRINIDFKLNVEVLTFHKLGMKFIRKIFDKPVSIVGEGALREIIIDYVTNVVFPNKGMLRNFYYLFDDYLYFDEDVLKYDDFNKYFKDYTDAKYEENINNLDDFIKERIKIREKSLRTINGEFVKSIAEVRIANYLYINGYNYYYEKKYPYKIDEDRSYVPDFTIEDDGLEYYVEYYGLTTYNSDSTYSLDDITLYNKMIKKKKELHKKYNTKLIELYSNYDTGIDYIKYLEEELSKLNIKVKKKTNEEIFYRLMYTNQESQYFKFINLCNSFINAFKEKGYYDKDFELLKSKASSDKQINQLKYLRHVYNYYNNKIHSEYKIDFNDMINYAYRGMERVKNKERYLDYDYLIIDEYQDISKQRYNFAKKLSDLFKAKIVAVGDDWQAIYSFSGSDINLFTQFYNLMGYAEIIKITNTYRNSQELINVAGEFVGKNEEQFTKTLSSSKHLDKPVEIHYYEDNKIDLLENLISNIYEKNHDSKILILGRFNDDIDEYLESNRFSKSYDDRIICRKCIDANIDYMSVHRSKGLGYDEVILINAVNDRYGFPSQIEDDDLIKILDNDKREIIAFPEERRLFYVALTRTKNKVYILCPYYPFIKRSEFIREINSSSDVAEIIDK